MPEDVALQGVQLSRFEFYGGSGKANALKCEYFSQNEYLIETFKVMVVGELYLECVCIDRSQILSTNYKVS